MRMTVSADLYPLRLYRSRFVVPLAQTGACLPRQLLHAVGYAALDIPQHRLLLLFGELLAHDDGLHAVRSAVVAQALVVEVGGDLQAFVADLAEGQVPYRRNRQRRDRIC